MKTVKTKAIKTTYTAKELIVAIRKQIKNYSFGIIAKCNLCKLSAGGEIEFITDLNCENCIFGYHRAACTKHWSYPSTINYSNNNISSIPLYKFVIRRRKYFYKQLLKYIQSLPENEFLEIGRGSKLSKVIDELDREVYDTYKYGRNK